MKKLATFIIILMAFCSCEKESEELLIGGWKDIQSDVSIGFQEGGGYSWVTSYLADPNSGTGFYEVIGDTLRIEENLMWFDTILVTYYNFFVSKNELELINLQTEEVRNYKRIKRYFQ